MHSTYRLQITPDFTLFSAAEVVPYLAQLGVGAVYVSPILRAEPGSNHGYDVVDPRLVDPARGGAEGLAALSSAARAHGLSLVVDIVPNHMGVATPAENPFWWDVLRSGRASQWADVFDIDWDAGEGKVILPVLGSPDDLAQVQVGEHDGAPALLYYENAFPLAPGTQGDDPLATHEAQHYRLVDWHHEDWELNYRRFFSIKTLAGVRVEDEAVFDLVHSEVRRWFDEGLVDALRIDHIDGLADPGGYLDRLAALTGGAPVFVEKIVEGHEQMPAGWATRGTTGYEAIGAIDHSLASPAGLASFGELRRAAGGTQDFEAMAREAKIAFTRGPLRAEMLRLARQFSREHPGDADGPGLDTLADAFGLVAANMDVYRTYLHETPGPDPAPTTPPADAPLVEALSSAAEQAHGALTRAVELIGPALREAPDGEPTALAARFQQTTGAVMAKGVEDTTFYRYAALTSLNEVGGSPAGPAIPPADLLETLQSWDVARPEALNSLTTHDTKRSEDTRARITALSEIPEAFGAFLEVARAEAPLPHRTQDTSFDLLLWQAVLGAWPASAERLSDYALKAAREAALSTTWTEQDGAFEDALRAAVERVSAPGALRDAALALDGRIRSAGWSNALAAKLVQVLAPGLPDVYQGTELWDQSLVDPDNRRPVDFSLREGALSALDAGERPGVDDSGRAKLLLTSRALRLRRDHRLGATSIPEVRGEAAEHVVAFGRAIDRDRGAIAVATRLPIGLAARGGFGETTLDVADAHTDLLTGERHEGTARVAAILERYPVALLVPSDLAGTD